MTAVILMRASLAEDDELAVAQKYFEVFTSRSRIPKDSLVIGRYAVLPYYAELEEDLAANNARLVNTHAQHLYVADMKGWYADLEGLTPKTYFSLEAFKRTATGSGSYVLKGRTNSKKQQWNTHMFAKSARDVDAVYARLSDDSFIGNQDIYIREFVPLRAFGEGIRGLPITEEYRFFVLDGEVLASGCYWSQFPEIAEEHGLNPSQVDAAWLRGVIDKIKARIRFFVIDVARTAEGGWMVVELNDGCMSGLSDVSAEALYAGLQKALFASD